MAERESVWRAAAGAHLRRVLGSARHFSTVPWHAPRRVLCSFFVSAQLTTVDAMRNQLLSAACCVLIRGTSVYYIKRMHVAVVPAVAYLLRCTLRSSPSTSMMALSCSARRAWRRPASVATRVNWLVEIARPC